MFLRILRDSLLRQKRRKLIVLAAVTLGTAAAAAITDIALDVGDKMSLELKSFGANLVVLPRGGGAPVLVGSEDVSALRVPSYLDASDVSKVKENFWKNNILALAPILDVPVKVAGRTVLLRGTWFERPLASRQDPGAGGEGGSGDVRLARDGGPASDAGPAAVGGPAGNGSADSLGGSGVPISLTGIRALNPYWSVAGRWPDDRTEDSRENAAAELLVGRGLAATLGLEPGARIVLEALGGTTTEAREGPSSFIVAGVLTTGEAEDGVIFAQIETVWRLSGLTGRVGRISVRALTTPESAVYERLGTDPRSLPPAEFERWTCTPFVSSIAYELERAVPGAEARVIRRVADSEGAVLRRTSGLMALIALMAALGSALTVTSALTTGVLERRSEIGLLKAMGAGAPRVVGLFLAEAATVGLLGGLLGAAAGCVLARWISISVFAAPVAIRPLSVPLAVGAALAITCAGCIVPVRRILKFRPFEVLRGL